MISRVRTAQTGRTPLHLPVSRVLHDNLIWALTYVNTLNVPFPARHSISHPFKTVRTLHPSCCFISRRLGCCLLRPVSRSLDLSAPLRSAHTGKWISCHLEFRSFLFVLRPLLQQKYLCSHSSNNSTHSLMTCFKWELVSECRRRVWWWWRQHLLAADPSLHVSLLPSSLSPHYCF